MNKISLIIVDNDENYLKYLNNFLSTTCNGKFEISCFTDKENLVKQINSLKKKDVLIINNEMYDDTIEALGVTATLFLDESSLAIEYEDERIIHKYRDVKKIREKVIAAFLKGNPKNIKKVYSKNTETKIITVYSPVGGAGKSTLAASLSNELSKEDKKVFYLNLEDIQSTALYFNGSGNIGFSDIILDVKDKSENFIEKLITASNVDSTTNVHYLNPTENILDIEDIDEEDIKWFLESVLKANQYSYIIIDTVSKYNSVYNVVLNSSHHIITPMLCGENSMNKMRKYIADLRSAEKYYFIYNMYDGTQELQLPDFIDNMEKEISLVINEEKLLKHMTGTEAMNSQIIRESAQKIIEDLEL